MKSDQFPDRIEVPKIIEVLPFTQEKKVTSDVHPTDIPEKIKEFETENISDQEKIENLRVETEKIFDSLGNSENKIFKTLMDIAKPGHEYRAVGVDGFTDIQESGVVRANQNPQPVVRDTESGLSIKAKHFGSPFFISNTFISTLQKYNPDYVVEVPKQTEEYDMARSSGDLGNIPWNKNNEALPNISAKYATVYKKIDGGYKKVEI